MVTTSIPQLKKTVSAFISGESGQITKQAILTVGAVIGTAALAAMVGSNQTCAGSLSLSTTAGAASIVGSHSNACTTAATTGTTSVTTGTTNQVSTTVVGCCGCPNAEACASTTCTTCCTGDAAWACCTTASTTSTTSSGSPLFLWKI